MIGNLKIQVSELEEEIPLNSKQISSLQLNLGALTVGYYDLKNKLIAEFGDKFKSTVEDPKEAETSQYAPTNTSQPDLLDNTPPVRTTIIVDRFEENLLKPIQE